MSYYILIPTLALVINTFVWSFVFGQRLHDPVSRRFLLLSVAGSGWMIGDILLMTPVSHGIEIPILWGQSLFWIPTGFLFLHFCYGIVGRKSDAITYIGLLLSVVGILIFVFTDWILIGYINVPWGRAMNSRYYPFWGYALLNIVLASYALFILFRERQRSVDSESRAILNLILVGGCSATLTITLINVIIPDVLGIQNLPRFGSAMLILFIVIVFIAVTKYRFLVISVDKVAEALFEEIEDGILLVDRGGKIQRTNRLAARFLADSDAGPTLTALFTSLLQKHPEVRTQEVDTQLKGEAHTFSVSVSDAAYRSAHVGKIVVIRDITAQRDAQKVLKASRDELEHEVEKRVIELRHAQKMEAIGTLAGGIAHDFNNILAAITGFTHAALQALPAVHPIRNDLNEVMIASRRAREIVQQILTFSRPKDRSMYQRVSIRSILEEVLELLKIAHPPEIEIEYQVEFIDGAVSCDSNQLSQVFLTLGTHAFQSMSNGGTLHIEATQANLENDRNNDGLPLFPGTYAKIRFSDEGSGMPEETLAHIFDPFYAPMRKGEGTGLGLSTAFEIIKNHDGTIRADSKTGEGSCFTIYLPLLDEAVASVVPEGEKVPKGDEHILVVDDEIPLQRLARRLLEPLGYRITTFSNGPDALTYFNTGMDRVDMVITDQTMPEMTGIQLAKHLLEKQPNLPIILMSGYGVAVEEGDVLSTGIRKFLKKPLPSRRFPMEIRTLLDES